MEKVEPITPLVSVIMPVYNAGQYLAEAIESILNQTFTDFEFLIFNDGSKDNSLEIIKSYNDSRIVLAYNGENKGYVSHLNEGIRMARGKYIARMDADDISLPQRLEKQVTFLEQNPDYVMCGSRVDTFGLTQGTVALPLSNEEIKLKMLYITPFAHPSVMLRKSILQDNHLFYDDNVMPAEDLDLWIRLAPFGKMYNIKESLLLYRTHGQNISFQKRTSIQIAHLAKTEQKYISYFFSKCNLSEMEVRLLHLMLYRRESVKNIKQVENLIQVIKKIENENLNVENIDSQTIKNLLREKFFYLCTTSTHLGLPLWRLYNDSRVNLTSISFMLKVKFFLKSLVRYTPKVITQ
jgi:glycosyltransferase involved in cell wall biosynthesis